MELQLDLNRIATSAEALSLSAALATPAAATSIAQAFQAEGDKEAAGTKGLCLPAAAHAQGGKPSIKRMPEAAVAQGGKPV